MGKWVWWKIWMSQIIYKKVQNFFSFNKKEVKKIDKDGNEWVVTIS